MNEHARVLFFATLRDKTGVKETSVEFLQGTRIEDIKAMVLEKYPALKQSMDTLIVAMNHEFAFDDEIVQDGAEIAMFPPVSGGERSRGIFPTIVDVVDGDIDINAIVAKITLPTTGGVCTFTGIVREVTKRSEPHETEQLEYDAYKSMAEVKMQQICAEIRARWSDVEGIAMVQRVGTLRPGTVSVIVACSAGHRDSGIFEAAHYGIDRLKEIVPIWKKEISKDGGQWVEGEYLPKRED